jgi:sporulation protein YlmC with PRC-barrel domain
MFPRKFKRNLIAALVVPALAAPAVMAQQKSEAQKQPQQVQQQQQQRAQMPIQMQQTDRRASQLIGMDVRSPQDENLGEIKDLVINTQTGNVEYVALAHGGFLGLGRDLYAYPLDAFQFAPDRRDRLVLNVTREQLKQAQGFDSNDWPKVREDRGFWARITDNFGGNRDRDRQRPAAGATAPERPATGATEREREATTGTTAPRASQQESGRTPAGASQKAERTPQQAQDRPREQAQTTAQRKEQFVRASDIKGERVRDQQGQRLGQIEDLIVNVDKGEVRYAIIEAERDRMVAVSMRDLNVRRDNGDHVVEYTKGKLDLTKSFTQDQWREMQRAMDGERRPTAERRTDRPAAGATAEPKGVPAAPGTTAPAPGERTTR